jgi:hypothetical protein
MKCGHGVGGQGQCRQEEEQVQHYFFVRVFAKSGFGFSLPILHNDSISALFEEKGPALFLKRRSTSPFKNRQLNAAISPPFFFQYLSVLHLGKAGRLFREKAVRGKGGERAVKGR